MAAGSMETGKKGSRMKAEEFYTDDDHPSRETRKKMWAVISRSTGQSRPLFAIRDSRSFFAGMAASLVLLLSGTGLYSLANQFLESRQPHEVRFDDAYRSAIKEFENVLPAPIPVVSSETNGGRLQSRLQQLALIDDAILELRVGIDRTDVSPLKRSRLRQLYSMKLQVLQDIIQQGDMEL